MAASLFDFLNSINHDKNNLLEDEANVKAYSPFIINRGLSFGMDTVLLANEMNMRWGIPKQAHYEFLLGAVSKRKRFNKWAKASEIENIELVKEYFKMSDDKAKVALKILTEEQIATIKKKLYKGGRE
jgi:hypothetical protein